MTFELWNLHSPQQKDKRVLEDKPDSENCFMLVRVFPRWCVHRREFRKL